MPLKYFGYSTDEKTLLIWAFWSVIGQLCFNVRKSLENIVSRLIMMSLILYCEYASSNIFMIPTTHLTQK